MSNSNNDENKVEDLSNSVTDIVPKSLDSSSLANYLSKGNSLSESDNSGYKELVEGTQNDMKSYLALYARSQLLRVEKLTRYLDRIEDKMVEDIDCYEPKQFIQAMMTLQASLNSAVELIKMIGTDDRYLNVFYTENNTLINAAIQNNNVHVDLPRESREKLRDAINKIKIMSGNDSNSN